MLTASTGPFRYHRGKHLIVKLIAMYLDESGVERGAPHFVMTGYTADPELWATFEGAWFKILRRFDVPEFHSKVFFWREQKTSSEHNYYKGWSDKKAARFLGELVGTIQGTELFPTGVAVDCAAFKERCAGERRFLTGGIVSKPTKTGERKWLTSGAPNKPYFAGFHWMLREGMAIARRAEWNLRLGGIKEEVKIDFVFDWQQEMEGGARASFGDMARMVGPADPLVRRLGLISYGKRKDHPGLQAADLFTFGWASFVAQGEDLIEERRFVMARLAQINNRIRLIDKEGLDAEIGRLREKDPALLDFVAATPEMVKNKPSRSA